MLEIGYSGEDLTNPIIFATLVPFYGLVDFLLRQEYLIEVRGRVEFYAFGRVKLGWQLKSEAGVFLVEIYSNC